jgi:hypothetical protein
LSPDQAPLDTSRGIPPLLRHRSVAAKDARRGANRSAASNKGMSWQQLIASNALERFQANWQKGDALFQ